MHVSFPIATEHFKGGIGQNSRSEVALAGIVAENMIDFSHRRIRRVQYERPAFAGCSLEWTVQTETHNQKAVGRKTVEADLDLENWHGD